MPTAALRPGKSVLPIESDAVLPRAQLAGAGAVRVVDRAVVAAVGGGVARPRGVARREHAARRERRSHSKVKFTGLTQNLQVDPAF